MRPLPPEQLKSLLLKDGLVPAAEIDSAFTDAKQLGQDPVVILISRGLLTFDYFYTLLAGALGVQRANLSGRTINESILRLIPEAMSRERRVIVFDRSKRGEFFVAMDDPTDLESVGFLSKYLGARVIPHLATDDDLNKGYRLYGKQSTVDFKRIIEENVQASLALSSADTSEAAQALPIVSIVDTILSYAVTSRASDIHIEIFEHDLVIRYRIDGMLHEMVRVSKVAHPAIVARIKILASLKLDEHMKSQDGRFRYNAGSLTMDSRVSVIPTLYGEKVVMRILPATQRPLSLVEIGVRDENIKIIIANLKKTYGMILVTGPTGSGKTTTLYTMLAVLNKPEVNIVTVEDPIEFGIPNVNQTQVNPTAGLTFATSLRAIVRQDPNVIMIGEIRDRDTADIAVHSALTGSLVLSTLHTNNAVTAVPRLLDIGVPAFLVAAVLNLVTAQRLVRHICVDCIESYKPDANELATIREQFVAMNIESSFKVPKILYRGKGCVLCGHIGYRSRIGIHEILEITEPIQQLIASTDFSLTALEHLARKEGMITMFEDGLLKAERGMTTMEEVFRVIRE